MDNKMNEEKAEYCYIEKLVEKTKEAQKKFSEYSQEQVDEIFRHVAMKCAEMRIEMAKMDVAETGIGVVEDKVIKNHFAAEYIYNKYKDTKTCGLIEEDKEHGFLKFAEPMGVLAGIVPTTNPVSTVIFKSLISLKTRNGIIFSPHPRAKKCTVEMARRILQEAVKAGAPDGIIGWIEEPNLLRTQYLMQQADLILATGGAGMVKAAYSSGTPALGVGAGNTPAVIDETADIQTAVSSILLSKTFDNGVICASEQAVVAVKDVYGAIKEEFVKRGAYILNKAEKAKVGAFIVQNGSLNSAIVGKCAADIAKMAGINVETNTKVLIAETSEVGENEPFSYEKLSPCLALYKAKDFKEAMAKAEEIIKFGGNGHTSALYTNPQNEERIKLFSDTMTTGRVLVNCPSAQGAIGDIYNFRLDPSLTLGCGTWGKNSISENVGVKHLMNIKSVAMREENMLWFRVPPKIYFKPGCLSFALKELQSKKKAFIVTDKSLFDLGYTKKVTDVLDTLNVQYKIFSDVKSDPDLNTINKGLEMLKEYSPDVFIALGGGSPIDAAKIIRLMYEHPEIKFADLAARFMDIRKRIFDFPVQSKSELVAIPTTSGTGAEITPFAIITDSESHIKYAITDYSLTPEMAIVDSDLVLTMPRGLCAASGIDAMTHALESYVSCMATDYTKGLSVEAGRLLKENLVKSYETADPEAREKVHHAATVAGMAFANAFLGVCHSMAHKLGAAFDIPHGIANAMLICQVIRYNATDKPLKQAAFPQYRYPNAKAAYGEFARGIGLGEKDDDKAIEKLINVLQDMKKKLNIPLSIKEWGISEKDWKKAMETLPEKAFDDQCTAANPRYPLIKEIEQLYNYAYEGITDFKL